MIDIKMPQRWDLVGEYDSYIERIEEGDFVRVEDVKPLLAEIERLRDALTDAVALIERLIDTRRCSAADLRVLNAARAALKGAAA
jgi:hypothetical protein